MTKKMKNNRERDPSPPSLLIAAHCSTLRRKTERIGTKELSAILDDLVRELNWNRLRSQTYLSSLNEIIKSLDSNFLPSLIEISSHYFFILIRNTIRNLLEQLTTNYQLHEQETYTLRNCILFIHHLVERIPDVSKILHWITDSTFLDALANCLNHIKEILKLNKNKLFIKQITRLLDMFCNIQQRLPIHLHQTLFVRLLEPTLNCLTSSIYVKCFKHLNINANSLEEKEKLFLIKCPHFLTSYNGPHVEKVIEQMLELILPRYVSILDKHMKTIKQWNRPILRAIHNLLIMITYAEGYFSSYTKKQSFRSLIDHLLSILAEPTLINNIRPNSKNMKTLIIDATLVVFSVLVYEPDALDYIKQRKPVGIFRQLTTVPYETIVSNAYMMLVYTIDENDIKATQDDLSQLLSITLNLLQKAIEARRRTNVDENVSREHIDRNIIQLVETLKGLTQYEQVRNEILKLKVISDLVEYYEKLKGLSKQLLLECLWTLSFNEQIAQQLRKHSQFILTLENIPPSISENPQQNIIRRTNGYSSRRNSTALANGEETHDGIQKVADGILWKLVKEPQFRENMKKQTETIVATDNQKFKYDMMISYSYADKEIVYKIQQFLANEGFNIWFNRDNIHREAMDIIADAIENSEFVIICLSDSYKRDNHCQAETEYALNCKRFLLPLIVRKGYKPDGWLSSIASNSTHIDFGAIDFKPAFALLMKEIKQQRKKEVTNVKPRASTPVSVVHTPSVPQNIPTKPNATAESSKSIEANSSALPSSASVHPTSRSSTPGVASSLKFTLFDEQQQQQIPARPISRPTTPGSASSAAYIVIDTQQSQTPTHFISRPSTPGEPSSLNATLADEQQQQIPARPISRPATPGSVSSVTSIAIDEQQSQTPVNSISRSSTPGIVSANTSATVVQQQRQIPTQPISQPSTPGPLPPAISFNVDMQHQQIPARPALRSPSSSSVSSDSSVTVYRQKQETPLQPISQSSTSSVAPPTTSVNVDKQHQQINVHPAPRSSTPSLVPSDASINVNRQQQQIPMQPISQPSTPSAAPFTTSLNVDKQHQQITVRPALRSPISSSVSSDSHITVYRQQPETATQPISQSFGPGAASSSTSVNVDTQHQQMPVRTALRSPTSSSVSSDSSITIYKQQQETPMHPISQSSTPSALSSSISVNVDKQHQQITVRPAIRSPTSSSVSSDVSINVNRQQQQTSIQSISQLSTPSAAPPATSVNVDKQYQQITVRPALRSSTSSSVSSDSHITVYREQQQAPIHLISQTSISSAAPLATSFNVDKQHQQMPVRTALRSSTSSSVSSDSSITVNKQQQQAPMHPISQSSTPSTVLPTTSFNVDKQHQQITVHPAPRSSTPSSVPHDASINVNRQQQQQIPMQPISQPSTSSAAPSNTSANVDKEHQQITVRPPLRSSTSNSFPSDSSITVNKQQQQGPVYAVPGSAIIGNGPISTSVVTNGQQQASVHPVSRSVTSDQIPPVTSVVVNRQQQHEPILVPVSSAVTATVDKQQQYTSVHPVSRQSTVGSVPSAVPVDINKQQKPILARSNSQPMTLTTLSTVPPMKSVLSATPLATVGNHPRLPLEYTNRKTSNSTYRSIPINAWRKNDVLDFLFDSNLEPMMPLCELMSGKALARLFRMCQTKPSRLYSQLNEELRVRFKGLPLPMGIYTQFLIEMEGLVGLTPEALPSVPLAIPKIVERTVIIPRTVQQQQPIHSTTPTSQLKTITPVETIPGTSTPHNTRIIERAVFRPASSNGGSYNFIVESVEESPALMEQVERYGLQFASLNEIARQHRAINSLRQE